MVTHLLLHTADAPVKLTWIVCASFAAYGIQLHMCNESSMAVAAAAAEASVTVQLLL
jgi:hypothetical protein